MQRVRCTSNPTATTESVVWDVTDPSGTSVRGVGFTELDPTGTDVGRSNPYLEEEPEVIDPDRYEQFYPYIGGGAGGQGNWRCQVDGIYVPCGSISSSGTVRQNGPNSIRVRYNGQNVWARFTATGDGYAGYVPTNATYLGGGFIEPIGSGGPPTLRSGGRPRDTDLASLNGVTGNSEAALRKDNIWQSHSGSTGGSRLGSTLEQIQNALTDCVDEIFGNNERGLRVTGMNFAVSGLHDGSFAVEISTAKEFQIKGRVSREETVVHTDATSFGGKDLADMHRKIHRNDPRETLVAYTPVSGQTKNYLANDLSSRPKAGMETGLEKILWIDLAGQIHELGNSLAARFGQRSPPEKYKDRDCGMTLEHCVFNKLKK